MSHFVYCCAECRYAECHYPECHYAECRGAPVATDTVTANFREKNTEGTNAQAFFATKLVTKREIFVTITTPGGLGPVPAST